MRVMPSKGGMVKLDCRANPLVSVLFNQNSIFNMKHLTFVLGLCLCTTLSYGQMTLSGKVLDKTTSERLAGATVSIKGSSLGLLTDLDGTFLFENLAKETYTLLVSFAGHKLYQQEVYLTADRHLEISIDPTVLLDQDVIVSSTRAGDKSPVAYTNITKKQLETRNLGQDIPFLLNLTPSVVTTSDAGTGIGYTGMWVRGSDPTRINITINGIPYNDAESQGTFWVNLPDFSSSLNSIQVQRGVGTSTNGSGSFGATVNLETNTVSQDAFAEINNSIGSFGTRKHNLILNSGVINDHWSFEGRLSKIESDGYIDRGSADLSSHFLTGSYIGKKTQIKALVFGGHEITYQSWYGTPQAVLENDADGIEAVISNNGLNEAEAANIRSAGRTFNWYLYDNQVDNFKQDHYQLHFSQILIPDLTMNTSFHYTYGRGFFEQSKDDEDLLEDYGLPYVTIGGETVTESDVIRRRWLDNDFYGFTYSFNYETGPIRAVLGGGYHYYEGDHFGEVIWAQFASTGNIRHRYYDNVGVKKDFNTYLKVNYDLTENLNIYGDLQLRKVDYSTNGVDSDRRDIDEGGNYNFFNPKLGLTYQINAQSSIFASYSIGNREPDRNDFVDSPTPPRHETLRDLEIGYKISTSTYAIEANFYNMSYKDQLVLTGAINDVGSNIRTNVGSSFRRGIELTAGIKLTPALEWSANVALSQNKIETFAEVLYDYGAAFDEFNIVENNFSDTDIAFSPNIVGGSSLAFTPHKAVTVSLLSKYVGARYLDNTSNSDRQIDAYLVNNLQVALTFKTKLFQEIGVNLLINNLLDTEYEANGYTFGYSAGSDFVVRENYLYPQAGRNILVGLKLRF